MFIHASIKKSPLKITSSSMKKLRKPVKKVWISPTYQFLPFTYNLITSIFHFFLSAKLADGFAQFQERQRSSGKLSQSFRTISEARGSFCRVSKASAKLADGFANFLLDQRSPLILSLNFYPSS